MVSETEKKGKKLFKCGECNFLYEQKGKAEECEDWCREKHSCNLDITKHSVGVD